MANQKRSFSAAGHALLAFFAVTGVWTFCLWQFGFYPFGGKSVLITDMSQQYIEFFAGYYDMFTQHKSLLFTWDSGMGMNFIGIIAYYLSSPLSLLVLLFPRHMLMESVLLLISLKIALAGATFSIFAHKLLRLRGVWNVLFSCAYALCGYVVTYCYSIMWLDGVLLLPLIVMAMHHLIHTKRMKPLVIVLFFLFVSNFYISYMVGLFVFLLFVTYLYIRATPRREVWAHMRRFLGSAGLAAGLAAFLLIPTLFALQSGTATAGGYQLYGGFSFNPLALFGKLAVGAYDSATSTGTPNLYIGLLGLASLGCWLFHKTIPRREKQAFGVLFLILFISMLWFDLDVVWHAFQVPTWFPFRYSFVVSFLALMCAGRALSMPDGLRIRPLLLWSLTVGGVMLVLDAIPAVPFAGKGAISCGLLLGYAGLIGLWMYFRSRQKAFFRQGCALLVTVVVCFAELGINTLAVLKGMDAQFGFGGRQEYADFMETGLQRNDLIHSLDDTSFYRVENDYPRNANDGFSGRYHGISHYSSMSNTRTFRFLKHLGLDCTTEDRFLRYYGATTLLDSLFGVKYVFSEGEPRMGYQDTGMSVGNSSLYQNPYALPLAFAADQAVLSLKSEETDPLRLQNRLLSALEGNSSDVYTTLKSYISFSGTAEQVGDTVFLRDDGSLTITITVPKRQRLFLHSTNNFSGFTTVYLNGNAKYNYRQLSGVLDCGMVDAGEARIVIPISKSQYAENKYPYYQNMVVYGLEEDVFIDSLNTLKQGAPERLAVSDTTVEGTITLNQDGVLFTSIPCDKGWTAFVDGKKVTWQPTAEAFITLPLSEGTHDFRLVFMPAGLQNGIIISLITLCIIMNCGIIRLIRHRQ